jgi:hypothetical protein
MKTMSDEEMAALYASLKAKGFISDDLSLETFATGTRVLESIRPEEDLARILAALRPPR